MLSERGAPPSASNSPQADLAKGQLISIRVRSIIVQVLKPTDKLPHIAGISQALQGPLAVLSLML
jgi:hypothetical protein